MKLASLKQGRRDGSLVVVDKAMTRCVLVPHVARTLQAALDDWAEVAPLLQRVAQQLEGDGRIDAGEFDPVSCAAPLPRAHQFADGSAYLNHVELVRRARGAEMPPEFLVDPLMYQGLSAPFLGPRDDIAMADEAWGIDLEAEVAVVTDAVPMGVSPQAAGQYIRLILLLNDVSLRNLVPRELAKGFGFFHSKPASACSPVAATPDELGLAWDGRKVNLPLVSSVNGREIGRPNAGIDMQFDFPMLIAHAAKTRALSPGTIIGAGTVSNRDPAVGASCLAEIRTREQLATGAPSTPFLTFGDTVRIEMLDLDGRSIFGAIEQKVVRYLPPPA
jgi:fumarylacetoacetate (FAA) hydrolase